MPPYMPHYCGNASRNLEARRNYAARGISPIMNPRQKPIADWMNEMMQKHRISARAWAEMAQTGKDTVSRAVRDDYEHVTTTTTIAKLADALGERPFGAAAGVPSAVSLASILRALHQAFLGQAATDEGTMMALAEAMRDTLLHLADEPAALTDPKLSQTLARASIRSREREFARMQKT
jgi:hypothetical protein